jgi:sulfite reductase alpha subunit-like flavoprotein
MIEELKNLYYREDVRSLEDFTKFAKFYNLNEEELTQAYSYYINKCWNSSSQYFEKANKRIRNQLGIRF